MIIIKRLIYPKIKFFLFIVVGMVVTAPQTLALSGAQRNLFDSGVYYYDTETSNIDPCSVGNAIDVTPGSADGSIYQSGLQPPYILEQFAIETLKAVAQKMNVPNTDTVTEQHVIALVGFMIGEGGDINNSDLFNPLNTGINDPSLIDGNASGSGVQSFKSFDAGVEATARTIVGSNQDRLAAILIKPDSTSQDFDHALAYYQKYAGNKPWAQKSVDWNGDQNKTFTQAQSQQKYFSAELNFAAQVANDYDHTAGLIIGTAALEYATNATDPSLLQFHPSGSSQSGTPSGSNGSQLNCAISGIQSGSIVQTAIGLSWPDSGQSRKQKSDATTYYQTAMPAYNGSVGDDEWTDCGVFVATVMVASDADTNYKNHPRGTPDQAIYLETSGKYNIIKDIKDTSQLLPGDILIYNGTDGGHTFIYVGQQQGFNGDSAAASLHDHVPQASDAAASFNYNGRGASGNYEAARLIK